MHAFCSKRLGQLGGGLGWRDLERIALEAGAERWERSSGAKEKSRTSRLSIGPARFPLLPRSLPDQPDLEQCSPLALLEHMLMCNRLSTSLLPTSSYFPDVGVKISSPFGPWVSKVL